MGKTIYAGSFDPFTFGHLSIALAAGRLFDEVIILVATNSEKDCLFSANERVKMIREVISSNNIRVEKTEVYAVQYARDNDISYMVRGVRDSADIEYEMSLSEFNAALVPEVQTVFLPASKELREISSSMLKKTFFDGRGIEMFCPPSVIKAMKDVK